MNSCLLSFFLIIPHIFSIGLILGEWDKPVSISILQLMYRFKVLTDTCLIFLSRFSTNFSSIIFLISGRVSETHSIYFLRSCCLWIKPMRILLYVKLHHIHLVFGFLIFFVLHEIFTWRYPSSTIEILQEKKSDSSLYIYLALSVI